MDQVKIVEDSLYKIWWYGDHITSDFLATVFHKFHLVHSWIPWPTSSNTKGKLISECFSPISSSESAASRKCFLLSLSSGHTSLVCGSCTNNSIFNAFGETYLCLLKILLFLRYLQFDLFSFLIKYTWNK